MPWKNTCPNKERAHFFSELDTGKPVAQLCKEHGISRKTGYKWIKRVANSGQSGLQDMRGGWQRSFRYDDCIIEEIIASRLRWPTWGPRKILAYLRAKFPERSYPSITMVKDLFREEGFSKRQKRKYCKCIDESRFPLREMNAPNAVWTADFKGSYKLLNNADCEPFVLMDGYSRYILELNIANSRKFIDIFPLFETAFSEFGLPDAIRTDNGPPFGSHGLKSLSPLSVRFIKMGIYPEKTKPGNPGGNAYHERFNKTLKSDATSPRSQDVANQKERFAVFKQEYNEIRPHEALNNDVPRKHYKPSTRFMNPAYEYSAAHEKIRVDGKGYIRHKDQKLYLSESLANEWIGLKTTDEGQVELEFLGYHLGIMNEKPMATPLAHHVVAPSSPSA